MAPSSIVPTSSSPAQATIFTTDQWKALASILGNAQLPDERLTGMFDSTSWIIDTSASHHVSGELSWFSDMIVSTPCLVSLPSGDSFFATKTGSVYLSTTIKLSNVLFVPQFSYNLLSISQLTNDLHYTVQLSSSLCATQDQLKELVGTRHRQNGLYYFNGGDHIVQQLTVRTIALDIELWHRGMGHPS